uniref:NAD(P)(+)--arginine ADP-ribosyltransferase n=1 Tax=Amphiprion percula TaxID=161767 RepID=A0A3P8S0S8_AMPPE
MYFTLVYRYKTVAWSSFRSLCVGFFAFLSANAQVKLKSIPEAVLDRQPSYMFGDCLSKAEAVTDKAITQKWESCSTNFSHAWSDTERNVREPTDKYIEKHHLIALYMYTSLQQPVNHVSSAKQKKAFGSCPLYLLLSEAIEILKHNRVTCLNTYYRTETLENHLNISNKQVHFDAFILVYSCFGANVTHYSALKQNNQVLIPPYEVCKVTDIQTETKGCKVLFRLRSSLNCSRNSCSMLAPLKIRNWDF